MKKTFLMFVLLFSTILVYSKDGEKKSKNDVSKNNTNEFVAKPMFSASIEPIYVAYSGVYKLKSGTTGGTSWSFRCRGFSGTCYVDHGGGTYTFMDPMGAYEGCCFQISLPVIGNDPDGTIWYDYNVTQTPQ